MRYAFFSPWCIPAVNLAMEVRLYTAGNKSRDGVSDANLGLALGGGGHRCFWGLPVHQLLHLLSSHLWHWAKALAPSLLQPQSPSTCSDCCKVRLGIALGDDPLQPLSSLVIWLKRLRSEAGLLGCATLGHHFIVFHVNVTSWSCEMQGL